MAWKHRQGGSWQSSILKRREGSQWVEIGDSTGGGIDPVKGEYPARFYNDEQGPPNRPTTEDDADIVYNGGANGWSSVQDAHDALSSGETLFISADNSPYSERLVVTTSQITIASDGAWLEQPGSGETYVLRVGPDSSYGTYYHDETFLDGAHNYDSTDTAGVNRKTDVYTLSVGDASPFSQDDVIHVFEEGWEEDDDEYTVLGPKNSSNSSGAANVGEFAVVESVDTGSDELTLKFPLNMPYPNFEQTHVGTMSWGAEDVHITGLNVRGDPDHPDDENAIRIALANECWIENMTAEDSGGDPLFITLRNHRTRFHDITMRNTQEKGINHMHHATRCLFTEIQGDPVKDYTVRCGAGGGSSWFDDTGSVDTLIGDVRNERHSGRTIVHNVHWGGWFTQSHNIQGVESAPNPIRFRSLECHVNGFSEDGADKGASVTFAQRPQHCTVKNGTIKNRTSTNPIFNFRLEGEASSRGDTYGEEIHIEDVYIEEYEGYDITDIGTFHENAEIDGLTFHNVEYDGHWLTRSDVEAWDGYNEADISGLEVTHD